jgi:hypothetical protein
MSRELVIIESGPPGRSQLPALVVKRGGPAVPAGEGDELGRYARLIKSSKPGRLLEHARRLG